MGKTFTVSSVQRYAILPGSIYIALALSALFLNTYTTIALFGVGSATLGLLFIGTHNAWDTVTYIVVSTSPSDATHGE